MSRDPASPVGDAYCARVHRFRPRRPLARVLSRRVDVGPGRSDKVPEDVVEGLERAPEAFIGLLQGRNFGKPLVRVSG